VIAPDAATAEAWGDKPPKASVRASNLKIIGKNALKATVELTIPKWHLVIREMCSPQLHPNGRNGAPTPDQPSGTPMLFNQHAPAKSMCSRRALQERSGLTERFSQ
jgi:hypothetical protein